MLILIQVDSLAVRLQEEPARQYKAVLNEAGIVVFPATWQHATVKQPGIGYEDDYQGNALAAILDGQKFEVRLHQDFSAGRVKTLWQTLQADPSLKALRSLKLVYGGQIL